MLLVVLYYAVTSMHWFAAVVFPANLRLNAAVSAWILSAAGEEIRAEGNVLHGPGGDMVVKRGCDALEPAALFAAAVLAFPAPWRAKLIGVAIGVPVLLVFNVVRIVSLHYVLKHAPRWFETAHVDIWQPFFIFAAMALWVGWIVWFIRPAAPVMPAEQGEKT